MYNCFAGEKKPIVRQAAHFEWEGSEVENLKVKQQARDWLTEEADLHCSAISALDFQYNANIVQYVATVILSSAAQEEFDELPTVIQKRVIDITARLVGWPAVSGAKPLRGDLHGNYRIRTGDYRVVFTVSPSGESVTIWKIANRGSVYE